MSLKEDSFQLPSSSSAPKSREATGRISAMMYKYSISDKQNTVTVLQYKGEARALAEGLSSSHCAG